MYTDETLLTFGKHKFVRLCRVPADYLLNIYKDKNCQDKELLLYIENNLNKIKARQEGKIVVPELKKVCEKITYISEKDAKHEIKKIREKEQEHKKPVRSYGCEKCGGWHLTSIPFEEWEKI
ncbi:MAG: hypothetical protein ACXVDZ_18260 [Bacteroidia bacterium]